jgi:hypothetical protein
MKKIKIAVTALVCLLLVLAIPAIAQAGAQVDSKGTIDEIVNMGVMVHGAPTYGAVAGRMVSQTAAYRAKSGVAEMSMVFPAPGAGRSIATARMYILSKTGYGGTASLNLNIYTIDGVLVHTVTSAPVDFLAAATGSWQLLSLSADTNNLYISPGEFLVAQVTLDPAPPADDAFDARVMFEILTH